MRKMHSNSALWPSLIGIVATLSGCNPADADDINRARRCNFTCIGSGGAVGSPDGGPVGPASTKESDADPVGVSTKGSGGLRSTSGEGGSTSSPSDSGDASFDAGADGSSGGASSVGSGGAPSSSGGDDGTGKDAAATGGTPASGGAPATTGGASGTGGTPVAEYTLVIDTPKAGATLTSPVVVSGWAPGFLNVEAWDDDHQHPPLAQATPNADGAFSLTVDTSQLSTGPATWTIWAWDAPPGGNATHMTSTDLSLTIAR
jgi:hypothetical protein